MLYTIFDLVKSYIYNSVAELRVYKGFEERWPNAPLTDLYDSFVVISSSNRFDGVSFSL